MPVFANGSKLKLLSCSLPIQRIMDEAIKHIDIAITCGHRDEEDQQEAFLSGKSKLQYPYSKHNTHPSNAVDFVCFVDGKPHWGKELTISTAFFIKGIAAAQGVKIRCGCDWNGNFLTSDESFMDAFHLEIIES